MSEKYHQPDRGQISEAYSQLQTDIIHGLEAADGRGVFSREPWQHGEEGGGVTRVITNGRIIEKGGVNFSSVGGKMPDFMKRDHHVSDETFFATGVSIVLHPHNPFVPIIHMNVRYFETSGGTCWFGGGIDLTPHYVVPREAREFHSVLKTVCDRHHPEYYMRFKQWADDYFFIPHRKETRGVGGIFFDRLRPDEEMSKSELFGFVMDVGRSFLDCYVPIALRHADDSFGENHKRHQYLRRGRYAEFNLVYDRGTRFGLETGGRTESILMSMPPRAEWAYDHRPEPGSPEEQSQQWLVKGVNWL